jgi:hypothetical protein
MSFLIIIPNHVFKDIADFTNFFTSSGSSLTFIDGISFWISTQKTRVRLRRVHGSGKDWTILSNAEAATSCGMTDIAEFHQKDTIDWKNKEIKGFCL